jgi:hypothetical protein
LDERKRLQQELQEAECERAAARGRTALRRRGEAAEPRGGGAQRAASGRAAEATTSWQWVGGTPPRNRPFFKAFEVGQPWLEAHPMDDELMRWAAFILLIVVLLMVGVVMLILWIVV